MATTILYGGSGHLPLGAKALLNLSATDYQVHYGYDTVANGHASEIACPPGGYALRISAGGARDFASWLIASDLSEIEKHIQEYPWQFEALAVFSAGTTEPERVTWTTDNVLAIVKETIKKADRAEYADALRKLKWD